MKPEAAGILESLMARRPELESCRGSLGQAFDLIAQSQRAGGCLLVCGNGGSAADAQHIVGELGKEFEKRRPLSAEAQKALESAHAELGPYLAEKLQTPIRAVSLCSEVALMTAILNDSAPDLVFAQQLLSVGRRGDVLLVLSTSGNSRNAICAAVAAKALGIGTIALTGPMGGALKPVADCAICAPGARTAEIQESHLPIYHALCLMLEQELTD